MTEDKKIKIGISIGDINGIGIEIILKTFADKRMLDFCTPVVFGSSKAVNFYKNELHINTQTQRISNLSQIVDGKMNVCETWKDEVVITPGEINKVGGDCAFLSLKAATAALEKGMVDVLVTAPINKENIQSEDFKFPGHTEYLEEQLTGKSLMILMTSSLRVGLITGHIPIAEVANAISKELIIEKSELMYRSLVEDFKIARPKIAVLGVNPHCGDNGIIGNEDSEIVAPAIAQLQEQGKLVYGPYAADGFFGAKKYEQFDAVLAMYHDQGLAPFKSLAFGKGVNFTAGLPKVRTSPDHGTAYEIAGKGTANNDSFKEALFTAIEVFKNRTEYQILIKNSLKKREAQ